MAALRLRLAENGQSCRVRTAFRMGFLVARSLLIQRRV
jgi:hypothetical protein